MSFSSKSRNQKLGCRASSLILVGQMGRQDDQGPFADQITGLAVHEEPVDGVIGDAAVVLLVLGPSEQHDALDLLADGGRGVADCGAYQGCSLAVFIAKDIGQSKHLVFGLGKCGERMVKKEKGPGLRKHGGIHTYNPLRQSWRWGTSCWPA